PRVRATAGLGAGCGARAEGPLAVVRSSFAIIDVGDAVAVLAYEYAGVAWLAPAERIEDRAVPLDATLACSDDARIRGLEIRVIAEEQLGGHGRTLHRDPLPLPPPWWRGRVGGGCAAGESLTTCA